MEVRLLWLDDNIDQFYAYIHMLESVNIVVDAAQTVYEGLYKIQHIDYDIILVDLCMPPPNGVDFIYEGCKYQPKAQWVVMSDYIYVDSYRKRLKATGCKYQYLEKRFNDNINSPVFAHGFVKPILKMVEVTDKNKSAVKRIIDAIEIKPSLAGIAIDIRKALGI